MPAGSLRRALVREDGRTGGLLLVLPRASLDAAAAAIALVALMVLAAGFHVRRPGEGTNVVFNLVLGLVAAFVAWGRIDALRF